ncbi:MAG: N4-gp56 family major capsid protein [Clostridia bacterium]
MSNINTTGNTLQTTGLNKTFYDRQLLESAKTRFVHAKFGQKRSLKKHHGKQIEFRRWNLFDPGAVMNGLEEGVTPTGQALEQTNVNAEISQYGAYVEVSDVLDMTGFDMVINDSAELLGEQLGTVVEWVTRDEICSGNNVRYANGKTSRYSLTANDKLTVEEIRKAVRTLKDAKARYFSDNGRKPHFICICSPEATYDLQSDQNWQDVSKYSNAEQIYSGEIGRLYGVVFVESTEAKIFSPTINKKLAPGSTTTTIKFSTPLTKSEIAYLKSTDATVKIGNTTNCTVTGTGGLTAAVDTITLSTALSAAPLAGTIVLSEDAGATGAEVHATLVFGKDAYGTIELEGSGVLETIIKPVGSAGTGDPLNQRATVGAKVMGYAAKILNDYWIVRIEHGVSA